MSEARDMEWRASRPVDQSMSAHKPFFKPISIGAHVVFNSILLQEAFESLFLGTSGILWKGKRSRRNNGLHL